MAEPPPLPDPRAHIADMNEQAFAKYLKVCTVRTRAGEVNLRKYRICGGVLNLDLLITPPQPKRMMGGITLTTPSTAEDQEEELDGAGGKRIWPAIVKVKLHLQWLVIGWVTKNLYVFSPLS
ncbi:hypothetical protein evm_009085 [Chilo suppressalis]|nr:hypothetical protein evm_009085 [Chilo suppressalis]